MEKENVVYTDSGIVVSPQKEGNPAMCDNMSLEGIMPSEISREQKDTYRMGPHTPNQKKIYQTQREVAARGCGGTRKGW